MTKDDIQAAVMHEGYKDEERIEAIRCMVSGMYEYIIPKRYWVTALRWLFKKFVGIPKKEEYVDGEEDWET